MKQLLLLVLFFMFSLVGISQQADWHATALSEREFNEDFSYLFHFLRENHGGFNRYTADEVIEQHFSKLSATDDSLSLAAAYQRCAMLIDQLHDGHTWVMPSEESSDFILNTERFIPFTVKVNDAGMFVDQCFIDHALLTEGRQIISVNGKLVNEIVDEMLTYFTADGFSLNGKLGAIEGQFWWYYGIHFGFHETHQISVATAEGETLVDLPAVRMDDLMNEVSEIYYRYGVGEEKPISYELREKIGILDCNSFSGWSLARFEREINEAFVAFQGQQCERLVIDLRGNGGGREGVENLVLSYLQTTLDTKYDQVAIKAPMASDYRLISDRLRRRVEDVIYRTFEFRRDTSGNWVRRERFQRTFVEPECQFTGEVYVLIDRNVFSGAAELAALIKEYGEDCTLLGEETCGGYQGHTSGYYYRIELPHSKFIVQVPRIWFDLNVSGEHHGGVLPDIVINQDPCIPNTDRVLEFALSIPVAERGE